MSRGLSRQQVAMLLVMRQRETGCSREGWVAPNGRTLRHESDQWRCHRCTTQPQDVFEALYADQDQAERKRRLEQRIAQAQEEMGPEEYQKHRAWLDQGNALVRMMASESTQHYREKHPRMGASREVSIERAFMSLYQRRLVYPVGRRKHGRQWRTIWY